MARRMAASLALAAFLTSEAAADTPEVDLALVLAVDVSRSMDPEEQQLQRQGYIEAFRSPAVHSAIRRGAIGRIAVVYLEWSGPAEQKIIVPWTVIDEPVEANTFADRLSEMPVGRIYSTSISGAIDFSVKLLRESGVEPLRSVIDVSGDGPNNTGRPVTEARDAALEQGIVINGLPFMLKRPTGFGDINDLDRYYEDCVIGGPGAFMVPIREASKIIEVTRSKLIREISDTGQQDVTPRAVPIQGRERMNCLIGELRRQQQWGP